MDLSFMPEEERYRTRVRGFLTANLPQGWGTRGYELPKGRALVELLREWQRRLLKHGFLAMSWPKEYGGQGASAVEMAIFNEECARVRAPGPLNSAAISQVGPTIMQHGMDGQKRRFLPAIINADEIWCQGFSEPNAGSDLASLRTRADLAGDEFIVNGQKIWTSYAQYADWCYMLVRTDAAAPKHRGISYLMVDMKSPGITVKPLRQMHGGQDFNEVFFENVRVPRQNLIGGLNDGWRVSTTTLANERGTNALSQYVRYEQIFNDLVRLARASYRNGRGALQDAVVRQELARHYVDLQGFKYNCLRVFSAITNGGSPGGEGSILKLLWSELNQRMQETAMALEGTANQLTAESAGAVEAGRWQVSFLRSRAHTIEAGTSEIQRNIIAQRVLGLPKTN
ncbi:MAG TPA: acyl-CoA dehydrogenase family protein [Candidatus Binataceae bacterium]|jgi:alkylation response protein AidB-like acyl-CoA dehydrogenase|nr:acyl-CoA dehydrogenase family protein [Candidatus Binataceae bacterium]